jgi:hypothetical protein
MLSESSAFCGCARAAWYLLYSMACAQSALSDEVRLGPIIRVTGAEEIILYPWAHADPTDGRHLMTCGSLSYRNMKVVHAFIYSSADSGATWQRTLLDDSTRWVTEVSCTFGQEGRAYFADGESDTTTGEPRHEWGHLQLFASDDRGMSWARAGRRAEGFVDWTYLAVTPAIPEHPETLVIFGNQAADTLGHWWKQRPVALGATDRARTISKPTAPKKISVGVFAGGSVVLPDRTAVFIAGSMGGRHDTRNAQLQIYAVSPSDQSVHARAILRKGLGRSFSLAPALARDPSSGRFHGWLYAAWDEHVPSLAGELWLASSDDEGYQWSPHAILPITKAQAFACPNDFTLPPLVRIAVNREGTLGVLWSNDRQTVFFSSSADGGGTFQSSQRVAQHDNGKLMADDAIALNEWAFAEDVASKREQFTDKFVDLSHLGLSIRMSEPVGVMDMALTADATGMFHAFWAGLDAQGIRALMTRTVEPVGGSRGTDTVLAKSAAEPLCAEGDEALHPAMPSRAPRLNLAGQRDVSQAFNLQVEHFYYDAPSRTVTADVVLINKRDSVLRGSFLLFGLGVHSDYGVPVALNANGERQGQPFWDLSSAIPTDGLSPKAASRPLALKFRLDQFRRVPTSGDAVAMSVRVFQSVK